MISIDEIAKIEEKKKQLLKDTYVSLYNQVSKKIRQTVEIGNKQLFVVIPGFVVGHPTFDRRKATLYIKRQLERGGFIVKHTNDYELYITWNIKKKKQEEPVLEEEFPSFINLKKAANKYRGK